jgi:integrase
MTKRQFGSVRKLQSGRWQVRYRDPAGRTQSAKHTFATKTDASKHLSLIEADLHRGDWLDPRLGRVTFDEWSKAWLGGCAHLKAKTRAGYESVLAVHVLPEFTGEPVSSIDTARVRRFTSRLLAEGKAPGTVRNAKRVLRLVLGAAVEGGSLKANPCDGVKIPRGASSEMVFLDLGQVRKLADAIAAPPRPTRHAAREHPEFTLLVRFAALTGLRAGEIAALRVGRLDVRGRRVEVAEAASEPHGELIYGPTKTYERRTVPIPGALAAELAEHLIGRPADSAAFVFSAPDGGPLRHSTFYRRHFKPAVARAGLPAGTRFHDLRHSYAALLIAEGAPALAVMKRLGHSSITVTMNTYGHLFPALEEALTDRLDVAYRNETGTSRLRAVTGTVDG